MSVLPFASAPDTDVDSWASESGAAVRRERTLEPALHADPTDLSQQVLGLKRKLEEAANELGRLQSGFASQQQLEQLLRQGRTHLLDLRSRVEQTTAERDRLQAERARLVTEFNDHKTAHQREAERLQAQLEEATRQAFLERTLAEQRGRDMLAKEQEQREQIDALRQQFQKASADRDRLAADLEQREAAHEQYVHERGEERATFERLLQEATANQREMVRELDEQREEINTLRETAMRAQSLAREIMRAHEEARQKTAGQEQSGRPG